MNKEQLLQELQFKAVRSSGAGGQNVNKVATKVVLIFDLGASSAFTETEKNRLFRKLAHRLSKDQQLILQSEETRSQHKNKALVIEKFLETIALNLVVPKKRMRTRPTKSSMEKRLKSKKKGALKKLHRRKPPLDQ
ncbi:aminoacyl-tRNA hydrolase [Arenibacter sp. 6A1]|uniref:alternative ribosome rescue aminoacyl-tRNA hydrolase ArfB n=1 Tax=Arenibacter sp. 6A1 TaxID=2720391 RepID=UPI00144888F3|nr:alternative ribosome rescue aminoacyl-tRNA hydrolase ArfB [Arenibacter sp. 6A1]NKI26586.1 aminoacyl-tRNA hydrolase [Arenibacter sp. 6A1]